MGLASLMMKAKAVAHPRLDKWHYSMMAVRLLGLFALLLNGSLMAGWSMPPEVIYPSSPPDTAGGCSIATDGFGNCVAVWYDIESSSLLAAKLASGAVNNLGQPDWIMTAPVASSGVQFEFGYYMQIVGMDFNGTSTAVWGDGIHIYSSTLAPGQTVWSTPQVISTQISSESVFAPYIAVAPNGNAIVTWLSSGGSYVYSILANVFDAASQTWSGQTNILGGSVTEDGVNNQVAVDSHGNAIIVVSGATINVQAVTYNFNANTFSLVPSIGTNPILFEYAAMDPQGNATLTWQEQDNTIHAATLPANQTALINHTVLSNSAFPFATLPASASDAKGNVIACWCDSKGALGSARYSIADGSWSQLPLLELGGNNPEAVQVAVDAEGNAAACWTIAEGGGGYIQAAGLGSISSSWTGLTILSPPPLSGASAHIVLTTRGDSVVVWNSFQTPSSSMASVDSSIFLGFASVNPPAYFNGEVVKNRFVTGTDRIHLLTWGASPDPEVVEYRLYRNGELISVFPAGKNLFTYEDHKRSKKVVDRYMLIAVNSQGIGSSPLYVSLQ